MANITICSDDARTMLCADSDRGDAVSEKAIERDDWPGPPEPAAAYPELCGYTVCVCDTCRCMVYC